MNGMPVEYYAQHIKNIDILGVLFDNDKESNRILGICTGAEKLALLGLAKGFDLCDFLGQVAICA